MKRILLNNFTKSYKKFKGNETTPKIVFGYNGLDEPLFDLNVGDYVKTRTGTIYHVCNTFIKSDFEDFCKCVKGYICDYIEYDNLSKTIRYDIIYDLTDMIYDRIELLDDDELIHGCIKGISSVKYLFYMVKEISDCYTNFIINGDSHRYSFPIDDDMFESLTIVQSDLDDFFKNDRYDNCIDYILSKDESRRDKIYNITKRLYDFISDKAVLNVYHDDYSYNEKYYIPIGIDNEKPYNIIFDVISNYLKNKNDDNIVSIYIGDLLNQDLDIIDYNKECYIKYKDLIKSNIKKIFYLYDTIIKE